MSRPPEYLATENGLLDPMKLELCVAIDRTIQRKQLNQRQAAILMGTSRANVSRVQNKTLERLTINQLFHYLARLCPEFRFMLSVDTSLSAGRSELRPRPTDEARFAEGSADAQSAEGLDGRDRDDVGQGVHDDELADGVFPGAHFAPSDAGRAQALQRDHEK